MKVLKRILVFALAILLAANGLSVNVKAADCTEYTKAFEKCADKDMQAEIDAIMDKIAKECGDAECVDPEKATMITFEGSPVKVVKYDGKQHGLSADVRQAVSGEYITEPVIWYVGITAEKEIYHSLKAPVEVGYYNAVVVYPGSCEWYPVVVYGVVVILPECDKPECPDKPVCPDKPECPDKPVCPDKPECPDQPEVVPPTDDEGDDDVEIIPVEKEEASPKTGDSSNVMLYGVSLAAALVAIVAVLRRRNA